MPRNRFDQASRYGAKLDAVGFLCWRLREDPATLRYRGWLDTRALAFPGDPERICDTVAWLGDADPAREWAAVVEFCLEPDETLFGRLLVYEGLLWLEVRPTDARGERFEVGAIVINLTGHGRTSRDMQLRQTGMRTTLGVVECNLAEEDAAATLAGIAAGTIAPCALPWIPLMQKGGEAGIIQQWLDLAGRQPDARRRADYGGLALIFAEAASRLPVWKEALKGWSVKESQQVLEWINMGRTEGRSEGRADALLDLLAERFPPAVPAEVVTAIRATTDLERLRHWLHLAYRADSLDSFRSQAGI
jgi:hypothetical protein